MQRVRVVEIFNTIEPIPKKSTGWRGPSFICTNAEVWPKGACCDCVKNPNSLLAGWLPRSLLDCQKRTTGSEFHSAWYLTAYLKDASPCMCVLAITDASNMSGM